MALRSSRFFLAFLKGGRNVENLPSWKTLSSNFFVRSHMSQLVPIQFYSTSLLLRNSGVSAQITKPAILEELPTEITLVSKGVDAAKPIVDEKGTILEVNDARVLFDTIWAQLEKKYGHEKMTFPREIIWLMGAPGSGKSYNSPWIRRAREITAPEIVMSSLLESQEAKEIKEKAGLVPDSLVTRVLLEKLIEPKYLNGVVVDGFPRTKLQVDCIKLLQQKMFELHREYKGTLKGELFRRPIFRVAVLYVDESESIARQLKRGREAREHNLRVEQTGRGTKVEERPTDFDEEKARQRYRVFKEHYGTLQELQKIFPFSIINTMVNPELVKQEIMKEFIYQSSLELNEGAYSQVSKLPLATEIVKQSRQKLVSRIDSYFTEHSELFQAVIQRIQEHFVPNIIENTLSGITRIKTTDPFYDNPLVNNMVVDILSERGFTATSELISETVPVHFNQVTGAITNSVKHIRVFKIMYQKAILRQKLDGLD